MLAATMMFGICACGPAATTTTETTATTETTGTTGTTGTTANPFLVPSSQGFDADNIVLQFAAVSDVHVARNAAAKDRVQSALQQLKEAALLYNDKGLDAIVVAGDLTDDYGSAVNVKQGEIQKLKDVYANVFGTTPSVPMLYALGNHDHDFERNGGAGADLETFLNTMGNRDVHTQYDVECSDAAHGSRHAVIGNYHFFFVEPITYACAEGDDSGAKFYAETKAWLDAELAKITAESPNQYIFLVMHPMVYGTVYGSELSLSTLYWYTKDLTDILNKYPQVVTFGGHLHFPLNDERSIMQEGFTSLGCGSVQYMAIENGGYDDMASATVMNDNASVSSGYLAQIDKNGNVRFIRMDFQNKTTIKDPFVIEAPKADGSHLTKYGKDRADKNTAPVLSDNAITLSPSGEDMITLTVNFLAGTDDDVIHRYVLEIKENGTVLETRKILSDYYRHGKVSDMKASYDVQLEKTLSPGGKYEITLTAYDSWDAVSNTVTAKYEPKLDISNVTLPDAYADIDFASGTATDSKGKVSVELVGGATVAEGTYTMDGVTKTLTGVNITGDGYAKVTFDDYVNTGLFGDKVDKLLKSEYAVELLYVNRKKMGTCDVFGGYNVKGFGIYEANGVPTFTNKFAKEFKTVASSVTTNNTDLVHVIVSYSSLTSAFSIYVNGERKAITGGGYAQMESPYFAIGANYGEGTVGKSAKDLSVVDVKIYNKEFKLAQAIVRYQQVLAEYKK